MPGAGTSTPTVSFPGVVELPGDRCAAEHAGAAGRAGRADVRVEVVERPARKKIACASAPYHGVNRAGLPCGSVTVIVRKSAWIACRFGWPCRVKR